MELLILNIFILIAADNVYTKYIPDNLSTPLPTISETSQPALKYEYKEVILYLTPSEIEAMKKDIKLLNKHLQSQHNLKFMEINNKSYTQGNKYINTKNNNTLTITKPVYESQEEYETFAPIQKNITQMPMSYPKELLKNTNKVETQNFTYIYIDLKKMEEDKLRKQDKLSSKPIAIKPKDMELKTLSSQDSQLLMFQPAYNYMNMFNTEGLPELYDQRELDKQASIIHMKDIANSPPVMYSKEIMRSRPISLINLHTPQIIFSPGPMKNEYTEGSGGPRYVLKPISTIIPDNVHMSHALTALDLLATRTKPTFDSKINVK